MKGMPVFIAQRRLVAQAAVHGHIAIARWLSLKLGNLAHHGIKLLLLLLLLPAHDALVELESPAYPTHSFAHAE